MKIISFIVRRGGCFKRVYRRYGQAMPFSSVPYSQYWRGGEVCSNGHCGGERQRDAINVLGLLQISVSYNQFC
jgi:hypothetical protein